MLWQLNKTLVLNKITLTLLFNFYIFEHSQIHATAEVTVSVFETEYFATND